MTPNADHEALKREAVREFFEAFGIQSLGLEDFYQQWTDIIDTKWADYDPPPNDRSET